MTLQDYIRQWVDEPEYHDRTMKAFDAHVNDNDWLKEHRDFIEANGLGFGDRCFHWLWYLISTELPKMGKFLEIGVYRGQTVSLLPLIARNLNKQLWTYAVTPLNNAGDKYSIPPDGIDYMSDITALYERYDLSLDTLQIFKGLSFNKDIKRDARREGPYDLIYIDGGHDYETVLNDIHTYSAMCKVGGYLVMDDAAMKLHMNTDWPGLPDVTKAVSDLLETDDQFEAVFSVSHMRLFRRIV